MERFEIGERERAITGEGVCRANVSTKETKAKG
jgi:hypothetical protein